MLPAGAGVPCPHAHLDKGSAVAGRQAAGGGQVPPMCQAGISCHELKSAMLWWQATCSRIALPKKTCSAPRRRQRCPIEEGEVDKATAGGSCIATYATRSGMPCQLLPL